MSNQGQRFRRGQGGHRKDETSSPTDTIDSAMLDFVHGNEGTVHNRLAHEKWTKAIAIAAAPDHSDTAAYTILLLKPGAELTAIAKPVVDEDDGCTWDTVKDCNAEWVKRCTKRRSELEKLYNFILSKLTVSAKGAVKTHTLWTEHALHIPSCKTINKLLLCIHLTFTTQVGVPEERASVEVLSALVQSQMGAEAQLEDFIGEVESLDAAVDDKCGFKLSPKQLVYIIVKGLNTRFDPHRVELDRAVNTTGTYPDSVKALRDAILRIDNNLKGVSSAFAVQFERGKDKPRPQGDGDGKNGRKFSLESSARHIKTLEAKLKKLQEENKQLSKQLETKAAGPDDRRGDKPGKRDDRSDGKRRPERDDRDDRDDRNDRDSKRMKDDGKPKQRSLPAGARGRHDPKVSFKTLKANHADSNFSDSDADDYDSDAS
jgi:hypothetical protein